VVVPVTTNGSSSTGGQVAPVPTTNGSPSSAVVGFSALVVAVVSVMVL